MPARILICNERLLFRFGVDRILLTLASALIAKGVTVKLLCLRADDQVKQVFKEAVIELEEGRGKGVAEAEYYCATHLRRMIAGGADSASFDLILCGGWPFFSAAVVGRQHKIASVFIDAGAVPHTGLNANARIIQTTLRKIRSLTLPSFTRVLPISRFIKNSQTLIDRGHAGGVETVYLGVDHLQKGVFDSADQASELLILEKLRDLKASGAKLVLNLGRFETQGYKNSSAALRVIRHVRSSHRKTHLIVLEEAADIARSVGKAKLAGVEAVGKLSDRTLVEVMKMMDAGLSVSLWEGFNLPIGEMQRLGKPALAYDVGAHAEVIAHPWCLALSETELADKLASVVTGNFHSDVRTAVRNWRNKKQFTWTTAAATYLEIFDDIAATEEKQPPSAIKQTVLVDVTNASVDEANSGVMRVTRRLLAELQTLDEINLVFIRWNQENLSYELPTISHVRMLASYGGPDDRLAEVAGKIRSQSLGVLELDLFTAGQPDLVLFMPEIALDGSAQARVDWAVERNIKVSAILYDLIPITHSKLCDAAVVTHFPNYVSALLRADRITAISQASLGELKKYCVREKLKTSATLKSIWLPGQFSDHPRNLNVDLSASSSVDCEIVYVSTIEPRKNHLRIIQAFKAVRDMNKHKNLKLILIGNSYAGTSEYAARFHSEIADEPSIEWKGVVPDEEIAAAISRARFTVYGSIVEGFGLPILESLWLGRPCLCHSGGVMSELADAGGCLTVNMESVDAIADGLERLLSDDDLLCRLYAEASARSITMWSEYSSKICLASFGKKPAYTPQKTDRRSQSLNDEINAYSAALSKRLSVIGEFSRTSDLRMDKTSRYLERFGDAEAFKRLSTGLRNFSPIQFASRVVKKITFK